MDKMKLVNQLFTLCLIVLSANVMAQVSSGGTPLSWTNDLIPEMNTSEVLGVVDVDALKAEDKAESQYKDIPLRFAYGHEVNFNSSNSGSWFVLPNGDRIWRLQVKSKGALSMNVTFSNYYLPEGAKLFIYSADKEYKIGAFTAFNNKESGYLGTSPVPGDEMIIEYFEPYDAEFEAELMIETVAHAYRDIFKIAKDVKGDKGFGDSGDCNNNVVCPEAEEWEQQIRSVAMITLSNGTRICSGSLLNNVAEDETPYFLTANHCLGSNSSTWVFIFNYFSDICDPGGSGNDGSTLESVSGSSLLAQTNSAGGSASTDPDETDMALLLLSETVPESYNVFYNGWDWSGVIPANTVCIHHPSGDVKKITWDYDEPKITGYFDETTEGDLGGTTHWRVDAWDDGTTEGGSSGSPLFNDDKQVIGQLHGGVASCFNNINDYYGRLALSFQYIQEWLDPDSTGVTSINGFPDPVILGIDPGLQTIQGIDASYCNVTTISPSINLKNYGSTEITAVDVDYYLDGNLEGTINWTGSLLNGESALISFGDISVAESGNHVFSAEIDYEGDENLENNQRDFDFFTTLGAVFLDLTILTDNWGSETSWAIFSTDGDEIASGSGYGPNFNPTLFEEQICVPDTCVEFVIYDSADDGICCDYGEGYYTLSYNGVELASGGEFNSEESSVVCPNLIDGIEDVSLLNEVRVYPNPAQNTLFIDAKAISVSNLQISLRNLIGQDVIQENTLKGSEMINLNVADLPRGMYLLELRNDELSRTVKVVLE
jgi:hypothetical protein